jgi:hypothetical protein
MNKILTGLMILTVLTAGVSCGTKEETKGKPFDNKFFTIVVPEGWVTTEEQDTVTIKKSETQLLTISATDQNTDSMEKVVETMKQQPQVKDASFEDATIGANTFKKIQTKGNDKVAGLIYIKGNIGMIIQITDITGKDEQAMLESLKIK